MIDLSGRAKALASGQTAPMMRGGTPVASYESERFRAILAKAPQSLNPTMAYLYSLLVYPLEYNKPPIMYIVAEKTHVSAAVLASMPAEMRELAKQSMHGDAFLCAFTEQGKFNLGSMPGLEVLETFEAEGIKLMREALNISGEIRTINDTRRGGTFPDGRTGCLVVMGAAPFVGYAVIESVMAILT